MVEIKYFILNYTCLVTLYPTSPNHSPSHLSVLLLILSNPPPKLIYNNNNVSKIYEVRDNLLEISYLKSTCS